MVGILLHFADDNSELEVRKEYDEFMQIFRSGHYEGRKLLWLEAHGKRVKFE
jgi:hypothetical protein